MKASFSPNPDQSQTSARPAYPLRGAPGARTGTGGRRAGAGRLRRSTPLWAILAAQAALTLPWLWASAPFTDEALYIEAGHAEWAHWLHQAAVPAFPGWFSGAPVAYPPLAAAADSAGGLPGARALSLVIMLATTILVYLTGVRIVGRLAGLFAALLFAVTGLVVHYGALATFGPLSLFLLVLSAWAAARVRDGGFGWLPACALALVAANVTKYATLAWDPVVFGIIALHCWGQGKRLAIGRAASVAATVVVADFGLLMLGGRDYAQGVVVTTVFRSVSWTSPSSPASVMLRALVMTGALLLLALAGIAVSIAARQPPASTLVLCLLLLAGLLAPIDQARIYQLTSLDKNIGYGLPFAAIGAGYGLAAGTQWLARRRWWGRRAAAAALVAVTMGVLLPGTFQQVQFRGSDLAQTARMVSAIDRSHRPGTYIVSDGAGRVEQYYLPAVPAHWWIGIFRPSPRQQQEISDAISCGRVSVAVLRTAGARYAHAYDATVLHMLRRSASLRLAARFGHPGSRTEVWTATPLAPQSRGCG
ncbi:MAG TPA: hypothetical protein VFW16_10785 [Streptosporangiaceae bacterium]|nr:hypothetical protein [Streptosporangiaceae bacterium]